MSYRYSVVTCVVGRDYEKLREVERPQPDVEYICATDNPDLESKTWKIVRPEKFAALSDPFAKVFTARYGQFSLASSDVSIWIDGSVHLRGSLDRVVSAFESSGCNLALMPHPFSQSIVHEYENWIKIRNYPLEQCLNAVGWMLAQPDGNQFVNAPGMWQLCFSIRKRCPETLQLDTVVQLALNQISEPLGMMERLDQTVFTYVVRALQPKLGLKILPVSEQILRSYVAQWYAHNSDQPNMNAFYSPDWPEVFQDPMTGRMEETWMARPQTQQPGPREGAC